MSREQSESGRRRRARSRPGTTIAGAAKGVAGGIGALIAAVSLVFGLLFLGFVAHVYFRRSPDFVAAWGVLVGLPLVAASTIGFLGRRGIRRELAAIASGADGARRNSRRLGEELADLDARLQDLEARFQRTDRFLDELSGRVDRNLGAREAVEELRAETVEEFKLVRSQADELLTAQRRELSGLAQEVARLRASTG